MTVVSMLVARWSGMASDLVLFPVSDTEAEAAG